MKEMKASSVKRKLLLWVVILTEAFLCSFGAPFQASAEENGQSAGNEKNGGRIFAGRQRIHE